MKNNFIVWFAVLLILFTAVVPADAQTTGTQGQGAGFTGTYDVTVTVDDGKEYTAKIGVEDLKNNKVKVNGQYKGFSLSAVGDVTGNAAKEGAVCRFKKKTPFFSGTAIITIKQKDEQYQFSGEGSSSYSYNGSERKAVGTVVGKRTSTALPGAAVAVKKSKSNPIKSVIIIIVVLGIIAFVVIKAAKIIKRKYFQ